MARLIKRVEYLQRFRKGDKTAFADYLHKNWKLIQKSSVKENVPIRLIIEETYHHFEIGNIEYFGGIAQFAKAVAKRKGKPPLHRRRK